MEEWPVSEIIKVNIEFHNVKLLKFETFKFNLKYFWNWSFFHFEKNIRFKKFSATWSWKDKGVALP